MKKETKNIIFIVFGVILLVSALIYFFLWRPFIPLMKREKEMVDYCENKLEWECNLGDAMCLLDCEKLNLEYFRYDGGGFGSPECWCKINNSTKQIW